MIKIDFTIERDGNVFRDAIHLPEDHTFSAVEIEAMKEKRYEDWRFAVENPPAEDPNEESTEELLVE
jgi:hypothetical protein